MSIFQERRASGWLLFRKGRGKWILLVMVAVFLFLTWGAVETPHEKSLSLQDLASLQSVQAVVGDVSQKLISPVETLPEPLRIRVEGLFAEIEKNPENREALLRELKLVLQRNFKGQEDCWSCTGTEYFDRYDAIVGAEESRKPIGLKDLVVMGDETYGLQRFEEARDYYSEALQIMDERVFQPEESIDTTVLERMHMRCQALKCR